MRNSPNLAGKDLRGKDLCGANLQGANFIGFFPEEEGADLREANLTGANLRKAKLHSAGLIGFKPKDCANYLRGLTLFRADLIGFFPKDEEAVSLVGGQIATLHGVYLYEEQKKRAFLLHAKLCRLVSFNQVKQHKDYEDKLREFYGRDNIKIELFAVPTSGKYFFNTLTLRGAKLKGAFFHPTHIGGYNDVLKFQIVASEAEKSGPSNGSSILLARGALLGKANMQEADLRRAKMGGIDLSGADLRKAQIAGACLYGADLRGAKVDGEVDTRFGIVRTSGSEYLLATGDADLRKANLCGADLTGADLRGADLRGVDLTEARDLIAADLGGACTALRN